jgi:hypothetical protein
MTAPPASHDGFAADCQLIEVHVSDLNQLFNSLDPTPFQARDLDPGADEFIAGWARELHGKAPLGLLVHVDGDVSADDTTLVHKAVRDHFARRAGETRRKLRQLFRNGRVSLVIGLTAVAISVIAGDIVGTMLADTRFGSVMRESLLIGGWVAMWRPLEIFLYDWWPVRADARLFDRLSAMTVRVAHHDAEHH